MSRRSEIVFAFMVGLLIYVAWVLRHALLLIYVAIILAIVLTPAVDWLRSWRMGRWQPGRGVGVLVLLLLLALIVGLFAAFAAPPLLEQARALSLEWPARLQEIAARIHALPFASKIAAGDLQSNLRQWVASALSVFNSLGQAIAAGLVLAILTAYFIVDGEHAFRWFVSLFSPERSERLIATLGRAERRISRWIFGQLLLMLILGVSDLIVYGLLGINFFVPLALFAGAMNFIPVVGPMIGLVPAVIVAATQSTAKLIAVLIFYGIYQQVDNSFTTPRVMRFTVDISPLAVVVALVIGAELAGILGALVAVPTAALIEVLMEEYLVNRATAAGY